MNIKRRIKNRIISIRNFFLRPLYEKSYTLKPSQVEQVSLIVKYKEMYRNGMEGFEFKDIGFKVYSQFEEDGIILYIFSIIGTTNKKCIEICLGDALESNTANLILNHRWIGLLFEANKSLVDKAELFYNQHPFTNIWPPKIVQSWIKRENINQLISDNGFQGEIDLLSIDIDGIDYWLWESITAVNARLVIVEYNHLWGPEKAVTVPYSDNFKAGFSEYGSDYAGASIMAFIKLAKAKGYRYIGSNELSTNAFFLKNDITNKWLPERNPKDFFNHPRAKFGMTHRWNNIKDSAWIEV